jgi:hypothetical protein
VAIPFFTKEFGGPKSEPQRNSAEVGWLSKAVGVEPVFTGPNGKQGRHPFGGFVVHVDFTDAPSEAALGVLVRARTTFYPNAADSWKPLPRATRDAERPLRVAPTLQDRPETKITRLLPTEAGGGIASFAAFGVVNVLVVPARDEDMKRERVRE